MALNPSGAISLAGPVAGQSIALELGLSPTAQITLNDTAVRTLAGVPSGAIIMPNNFWGKSNLTGTQKAIFGYGQQADAAGYQLSMTNLVSNTGVMATDTPGVGQARGGPGGTGYGGDKAIFGYGISSPTFYSLTNLVSNTGVVAGNTPGVGTARAGVSAVAYGTSGEAMFAFGVAPGPVSLSARNLISNTGVVSTDSPSVATARNSSSGTGYGSTGQAIFGFGNAPAKSGITNLVSNTGVIASDTPAVGTPRNGAAAATYGGDKAVFGFGSGPGNPGRISVTNLVSNTGVVASNTTGTGTARFQLAAAAYGGDKAIFGFGAIGPVLGNARNMTNLISNTGVCATDVAGVGTSRSSLAAAGYSLS